MHLADAFIQSDLQCIQAINFNLSCVPGDQTPNLVLANAMLYHLSYRNTCNIFLKKKKNILLWVKLYHEWLEQPSTHLCSSGAHSLQKQT